MAAERAESTLSLTPSESLLFYIGSMLAPDERAEAGFTYGPKTKLRVAGDLFEGAESGRDPVEYRFDYAEISLLWAALGELKTADWTHTSELSSFHDRLPAPSPPKRASAGYYGPNWSEIRERVIRRDDESCQQCGVSRERQREEYGVDLHVHHRVPFREFSNRDEANHMQNLVTLCQRCHGTAD